MNNKLRKRLANFISNKSKADDGMSFYTTIFQEMPHIINLRLSDGIPKKYTDIILSKFILEETYKMSTYEKHGQEKVDKRILIDHKNKILIVIEGHSGSYCHISYSPTRTPDNIINKYLELSKGLYPKPPKIERKNTGRIFILAIKGSGMKQQLLFTPFKLDKFNVSIEDNYNDNFKEVSDTIIKRLDEKDGNGIVILDGEVGTGKSFYLRYLCKALKKKVLYIPPALVQEIVSPFFMKLLGKHKNSVLVIEDADNVLRKRDERSNTQEVSSLLNITDGMLHDVLKLQIVATFNTSLDNIDDAFLRKGRLIAEHRFEKLTAKKAQALSNKLGYETKITEPMSLTDVYNQNSPIFRGKTRSKAGFKLKSEQVEQ
jgi:hypothetical protein